MKILIFGATGFLGKYLVKEFSAFATKIYIVSRSSDNHAFSNYPNIEMIKGDITDLEIINNQVDRKKIIDDCDLVIHAAALYDMTASYADLYLQNIVGTKNVLHFVKQIKNLKAFYYISTIAVADEKSVKIDEVSLPERTHFPDNYSKTKYFAEVLVREFASLEKTVPVRIIRPGAIVGDSITGVIEKSNGPYYFIEALKKYKKILSTIAVMPLTYNPQTKLSIIPVDHVANFIFLLVERDQYSQDLKTYHLICVDPPSLEVFINDVKKKLQIDTKFYPISPNKFISFIAPYLKIPKEIIPFMFSKVSYDNTLTLKDLPELKNCKYANFKNIF